MENKILHEKRKHSKFNKKPNKNLTEERNQNLKKIKKITKKWNNFENKEINVFIPFKIS